MAIVMYLESGKIIKITDLDYERIISKWKILNVILRVYYDLLSC